MSSRHAAVARNAAAQTGRDIASALTKLAWQAHRDGNTAASTAFSAAATLALSRTIQTGSEANS